MAAAVKRLSLLFVASAALADDAADDKKCKVLIDDGRNLADAGKLPAAMAKFEACLKIHPGDPVALGEAGVVALQQKDLDKAEKLTRKAIAAQPKPEVRGALLFNLGMILDARKDKPGAIAAYADSLRARPNKIVRDKLRTLDATVAAQFDAFAPVAMAGPFKSVDAFCQAQPAQVTYHMPDEVSLACTCGKTIGTAKPAGPFKHAVAIARTCGDEELGEGTYHVAVETDAGWFFHPIKSASWIRVLDLVDVPALAIDDGKVKLEIAETGECHKDGAFDLRELVVVGIGASGKPSATPPIRLVDHYDTYQADTGEFTTTSDVKVTAKWTKDGKLEIAGKTTGLDKATAGDLVGTHALTFP